MTNTAKERRAERKREKMLRFIGALMSYSTVREAAESCNISARTATTWIKSREFRAAYSDSRQATMEAVTSLLRAAAPGAVERLAKLAKDDSAPATASCSAARSILDGLLRLQEAVEIESRIAELEKLAGGKQK